LPLHYAVTNKALETVVKALFEAHPEGAKEKGEVCVFLTPSRRQYIHCLQHA